MSSKICPVLGVVATVLAQQRYPHVYTGMPPSPVKKSRRQRRKINKANGLLARSDGLPCPYCRNTMRYHGKHGGGIRAATRDHIRPRRAGGTLVEWNCLVVCASCNNDKGDMMLREFVLWLEQRRDYRAPFVRDLLRRGIDRFDPIYGEDAVRKSAGLKPTSATNRAQWEIAWTAFTTEPKPPL